MGPLSDPQFTFFFLPFFILDTKQQVADTA